MDCSKNSKITVLVILFSFLIWAPGIAQSASEILNESIKYHDPDGVWTTLSAQLHILMETPDASNRNSFVSINRLKGSFSMEVKKDGIVVTRYLTSDTCYTLLNGKESFTIAERDTFKLTCERTKMYRDYYTFLYGMPMKIRDNGAHLNENALLVNFKGKKYWKLKVTYDEAVGKDVWYFYFNTKTFALEAYQFFHNENTNDGEYILFSNELTYKGMKIPKVRKWYMNRDDQYLGVDDLISIKSL